MKEIFAIFDIDMKFTLSSCVLLVIFLFLNTEAIGQKKYYNPAPGHYKSAYITLSEDNTFRIKDLVIGDDSLSYFSTRSRQMETISVFDVEELRVKKNNKFVAGAIIGSIVTFIFILEPLIDNEPNADNAWLYATAAVAGGGLIGAGIGLTISDRETYHLTNNLDQKITLIPGLKLNQKMLGARLVLNF